MSKKGENIYKRKDGRWEARYTKGYDASGKVRYGYCYGKTYREAKEKANEMKKDLYSADSSEYSNSRKLFGAYCDDWLLLSRNKVKESTYVKYSANINNHIKPYLGGIPCDRLTTLIIENFSNALLNVDRLSPKTVRDILCQLKSILNYVSKQLQNKLDIDIVYPKEERQEMRVLSLEEQNRFIKYLLTDIDECKFGVLLALLTGMRIGEICALKWKDISLRDETVHVGYTMQRLKNLDKNKGAKTKVIITAPKSDKSVRVIPLTSFAAELCRSRKMSSSDAFILSNSDKFFVEPRGLQYKFKKYTTACGLEGVHFHILRHTFATRCVEVGFEIKSLSEVLGHSSPKITLERYVHSSLELKRDNMNKLAAIGY